VPVDSLSETIDYPLRAGSLRVEPLRGHEANGLLGMERAVRRVIDYVSAQGEGKFLISGFGGVGKSSLVQRVVHDLQASQAANGRPVVLLELPARTLDDSQLVGKRLLWHLRWAVEEGSVRFGASKRARLLEAYDGVAASNVERAREEGRGIDATAGVKAPLELGMKASHTETFKQKAVYEPYDVHTSLLELSQLISDVTRFTDAKPRSLWERLFSPLVPAPSPLPVVVIDRIAKWDVVRQLANLFSARGVVFLVVVPPEVRAEWTKSDAAGFDELQGFQDIYLSCMWDDLPRLLAKYLAHEDASTEAVELYPKLVGFLTFASGGIPRKCVQILLKHEDTDDHGRKIVRFDRRALRTIEFYHRVFEILNRHEAAILGEYFANYDDADKDRSRRCVIASAREIISLGVIPILNPLATMTELAIALRPPEQDHIVQNVIDVLLQEGILVRASDSYTLSMHAREHVADGRAILGTGILPRISTSNVGVLDPPTALVAATPPKRLSGRRPSPVSAVTCTRCGTQFGHQDVYCPNCGTELLEDRIGEPERAPDRILDALNVILGPQYEIDGLLGSGGMAFVYLGVHRQLRRRVAIKVLRPEMAFGDQAAQRFLHEAQVSAALQHPRIGAVYDFGQAQGLIYFVMQYIGGQSLDAMVHAQGKLSLADAGHLLIPIAEALAFAHLRGIIHRDVKPANILIDDERQPYLVDFGIASASSSDSKLTATGMVIGTPAYMSPEQAEGVPVTAMSDQYSFGLLLYYALSERLPFENASPVSLLVAKLNTEAPALSTFLPGCAADLDAFVARLLRRDPAQRFASMFHVAAELSRISGVPPR
jgi:predicted Ser/Thr protein kinase